MGSLKTLAIAGVVLTGATAVASAADLRGPIGLPPPPMVMPIAESSGWYLRGDIGMAALNSGKPSYSDNPQGVEFHPAAYATQAFIGVGVGYQFNSWLRFDLTGEYRGSIGSGRGFMFNDTYRLDDGFTTFAGTNKVSGTFTAALLMANAYIDLGTWHGMTPFIGAGVGYASKMIGSVKDNAFATAVDNGTGILTDSAFLVGTAGSKTTSGFAWALMAGVGYDVSPNYKVEFGYRYLNLGTIESGQFACGACAYTIKAKNVDSHEMKVGLRYMFGGASYAPIPMAYPEPRVVTKF